MPKWGTAVPFDADQVTAGANTLPNASVPEAENTRVAPDVSVADAGVTAKLRRRARLHGHDLFGAGACRERSRQIVATPALVSR